MIIVSIEVSHHILPATQKRDRERNLHISNPPTMENILVLNVTHQDEEKRQIRQIMHQSRALA
jgi:hypothetical protein